jgi:hypothetical protein
VAGSGAGNVVDGLLWLERGGGEDLSLVLGVLWALLPLGGRISMI